MLQTSAFQTFLCYGTLIHSEFAAHILYEIKNLLFTILAARATYLKHSTSLHIK